MQQVFEFFLSFLGIFIEFQLLFYTNLAFWGLKKTNREYEIITLVNNEGWKEYDYAVVLDVDNIISTSYLKEINS